MARMHRPHVENYVAKYGPVPPGLDLDHLCRIRRCINPDHLEPVTNAVNSRRGARAKLTLDDVVSIRAAYTGVRGQGVQLARQYQVTGALISAIVRRKRWKDV